MSIETKVSIIIPAFNAGELLGEMIESVLSQSFQSFELIIVDDGSSDNTVEVVKRYKDSRISCFQRSREPKGAQTCRNIGFERSKGEYVCFFDADDLLSPKCLEQRVSFMENNRDLDFGVFPASSFSPGDDISEITKPYYGIRNCNEDALTSLLKAKYQFLVVTNIYRKSFLLHNQIVWDESVLVYQDFQFNFTVLLSKPQYAFCDTAVIDYFYRINHSTQSITASFISNEKCESTLLLFDRVLGILNGSDIERERKYSFLCFISLHFSRLLRSRNKVQIRRYLRLIKKYYGVNHYLRYAITMRLSVLFKNSKNEKAWIMFLLSPQREKLQMLNRRFNMLAREKTYHKVGISAAPASVTTTEPVD